MLPINPARIPEIYQQAIKLQNAGKRQEAIRLYDTILNTNPKIAEAHFQRARLKLMDMQFREAVDGFAKAAALKPKEGAIWQGYTEALLRLDDPKATSQALKTLAGSGLPKPTVKEIQKRLSKRQKATRVATGNISPKELQAVVDDLKSGNPASAEKRAARLLQNHPKLALLHNMRAEALHMLGRNEEAGKSYQQMLELDPDYAEGHSNYGGFLLDTGDLPAAIRHLETARSHIPGSAANLARLARAYLESDKTDLAEQTVEQAIKAAPNHPEPYLLRGRVNAKNLHYQQAIADFDKARSLGLDTPNMLVEKAKAQSALDDLDGALATLDAVINRHPDFLPAHETKATVLQTHGEFDRAEQAFLTLFDLAPHWGKPYRLFSASHKFTDQDDPVLQHMLRAVDDPATEKKDKMQFAFGLAKAMKDLGEYDREFGYMKTANSLMREQFPYDIKDRRDLIDKVKAVFAGFDPDTDDRQSDSDYAPIFITGMPRSGTTLVEQIISSHSTVTAAGELGRLPNLCLDLLREDADNLRPLADLTKQEIATLAPAYQKEVQELLPGSDRISDKTIQTYLLMGLVWLALPKARIIVVRRDPRDNLLSIYQNVFPTGTHLYSYDLKDLAEYYKMFVEMIDFWREIAPDRFTEIWYDDLIENPEEQSRKLIAACGLEWEDACLNFHQNKRRVDTLSVYQVRQPIYRSSLKGWKRYETQLQELFDALGDAG